MKCFSQYAGEAEYEAEKRINTALAQTVSDWEGVTADHKSVAPDRALIQLILDIAGLPLVSLDIVPAPDGSCMGDAFITTDEGEGEIARMFFI